MEDYELRMLECLRQIQNGEEGGRIRGRFVRRARSLAPATMARPVMPSIATVTSINVRATGDRQSQLMALEAAQLAERRATERIGQAARREYRRQGLISS